MFQGLEDGELATLNVVLVGDSGVGKTSIVRKIANG
jgi:GTPase SAR1 family protein